MGKGVSQGTLHPINMDGVRIAQAQGINRGTCIIRNLLVALIGQRVNSCYKRLNMNFEK